jgi:hypothetical protein
MGYAARLASRHTPDDTQVQVILGTLLGRGRLVAEPEGVRLVVTLDERHAWLAEWTYERIAPLAPTPHRGRGRVLLRSEIHPMFADLTAALDRPRRLLAVVRREALWVWAMYARVGGCERLLQPRCTCAPVTPPPLRTLRRAS